MRIYCLRLKILKERKQMRNLHHPKISKKGKWRKSHPPPEDIEDE
jgi:hypothetical protein